MDWILLGLAAYAVGQIIFVIKLKADRPGLSLATCAVTGLAWPYLVALRFVVQYRRGQPSQW